MDNVFISPKKPDKSPWKTGTVIAVESEVATIKFDGEDTASQKKYKCAGNYTPSVNDHVLIAWWSGSGVILCNF